MYIYKCVCLIFLLLITKNNAEEGNQTTTIPLLKNVSTTVIPVVSILTTSKPIPLAASSEITVTELPTTVSPNSDPTTPVKPIPPTVPSSTTLTPSSTPLPSTPPSPSSTATPETTPKPNGTTSVPVSTTEAPHHTRQFDGPSFIGGIVLASGLMAIGFVAFKFYKARTERNYHTL